MILSASFPWSHLNPLSQYQKDIEQCLCSLQQCGRTFRLPNFDSSQGPNVPVSWVDGSEAFAVHTESTQGILQFGGDLPRGLAV